MLQRDEDRRYLASGYVTSDEVISMIERILRDATSPFSVFI